MAFARLRWPLLLAALLLLSACEVPFEPYAETDRAFSVFGILDASDEQHRVRVEALQDGRPFSADSIIDATVTLERLATGRTVTLENEPMTFQGLKHNFRTDAMGLRLNETYRLTVRRTEGGHATTAATTTPHEIPELTLSELGLRATVEGGTKDQLLFLSVDYHTTIIELECEGAACSSYEKTFELKYAQYARRTDTGYTTTFDWKADVDSLYSGPRAAVSLNEVDVQVGLVHPSTPTYEGLSYTELFRPEVAPSNVENGVGFVAGVTTDRAVATIPFARRPQTVVPIIER